MLFARDPFTAMQNELGRWPGSQVTAVFITGCRGTFEQVVTERRLEVDGFPAFAHELAFGEGPQAGEPSAYEYFVNLTPGRPCEEGESLVVRTEVDAPGSFEMNREVVDQMVATTRFER
jgi:hypothetical protein